MEKTREDLETIAIPGVATRILNVYLNVKKAALR